MLKISANEIKTKGIGALENETLITVRGREKFIVLDIESYNYLRECELDKAISESINDIEKGDYKTESVDEHIKRVLDAV
ncbi:MAG: hypothetical protein AB7E48_06650 [Deferribacterales bacterium]